MAEQITEFENIAKEIYQNRAEHEKAIKELFVKTEICTIDVFYRNFQQEIRDINSEITPSKDHPSITDFKEIFHTFEKYPSNLQRPKKPAPKELNRTLAMSRVLSASEINTMSQNNVASSPQKTVWEQGPTVSEIYSRFRGFRQDISKLLNELKDNDLEADYRTRLQKLNTFTKDIEKLCGTDGQDIQQAFSNEEAAALRNLAVNLEKSIFINENRNLFREESYFNQQQNIQSLENVLELLTYWLNSVGHYNDM